MSYSTMLFKILQEKNLTDREVVNKCRENGTDITEEYFNKIKNNKKNPPSEKVSRAIAKACGVDERLLVIEGYIDKSPKEIQDTFKFINFMANSATVKMLDLMEKKEIKKLKEYIDTAPVSETIVSLLDSQEQYTEFLENDYFFEHIGNNFDFSLLLKEPQGIEIIDNAMFPILQEGDKVDFEIKTTYNRCDILLIRPKDSKKVLARYMHKFNSTYAFVPINPEYKEIIFSNEKDFSILGRVNKVIHNIWHSFAN